MLKNRVLLSMKGRSMPATNAISSDKLLRLVGTPNCPSIVDVRPDSDFTAHPGSIPGAVRRPFDRWADWADSLAGQSAIVVCRDGTGISPGIAAWLRASAIAAETLEGGIENWTGNGLPAVARAAGAGGGLPPRGGLGRTIWVTRARPKVDRIACPWLIRRFVDREARFLYVAPSEVMAVAGRFQGTP